MIKIEKLNYLNILENISLTFSTGITGIIGPNGAGKSTLVRCISGMIKDYEGKIIINDVSAENISVRNLARELCYIPQKTFINYDISVREFLFFSRYSYNENINQCSHIIENALDKVKMTDYSDRNLRFLSGGEFQKIMLASAIVQESNIWILDEPGSALDPGTSVEFYRTLREIYKRRKISILIVSHDLNHILNICDDIVAMKKGNILKYGKKEEFLKKDVLRDIYSIDFDFENKDGVYRCFPEIQA